MPRTLPTALCVLLATGCSNPSNPLCTPGQTVACTGPNGCEGTLRCNPAGSGYGACSCGGGDSGVDGGFDGGKKDAGADGGTDAGLDGGSGPFDGGQPECLADDDCRKFNDSRRCDARTATCVPGRRCAQDVDCASASPNDPCFSGGLQCRCVAEAGPPDGLTGVCRRRHGVCEGCASNAECGSSSAFSPAGECRPLTVELGAPKFCFQANEGACACGLGDDGGGFCTPQNLSCGTIPCSQDKTCPSGTLCNVPACQCEPRCRWDFAARAPVAPGCPQGNTCWVDNANLLATSPDYGVGRCRPPCGSDTVCTLMILNSFGGPKLKCASEALAGGGVSAPRCRAAGACMDDAECPALPAGSASKGYCDRNTFTCKIDCRLGIDPTTTTPYNDCRAANACHADGGARSCSPSTCAGFGGAALACARGQYCCGEDKDGDGGADPCPPAAQRQADDCYGAPTPPFCTACATNADCLNAAPPAWLTPCANGSKSPSCSPLPMVCAPVSPTLKVCAPSTFNDSTRDVFGVGRDVRGCPAGVPVVGVRPRIQPVGDDYCATDSDCDPGTDAGRCLADPGLSLPDGGHPKSCQCTGGTGKAQCPNNDAGLSSECRWAITGQPARCVESVVCLPSLAMVKADAGAPLFGCGL